MNPAARHISDEQLVDFTEDRLSAEDRPRVEAHITSCPFCHRQAEALHHLIDVMRADDSSDAPEHVQNRAFRLLRTHRLADAASAPRRSFTAILRMDSAQRGFALTTRAGRPTTRQLLFDIGDDNELEVRLEPVDGGWRVAGQVLGACTGGGQVVVEGVNGQTAAELDAQCEFSLPPQPGAIYKLVLQLPDVEVEVPILELRS
jgi:anti-sigma factor RsiW